MVNTRNNHYNGQGSNTQANNANNNNSQMEQLQDKQNQLTQTVIQTLIQLHPNH
jgi:hypothetical protein